MTNLLAVALMSVSVALCPVTTVTVDGADYPLCAEEDCSDQPNQTGVWRNDGRDWLIVGEATYPIER